MGLNIFQLFEHLKEKGHDLLDISIKTGIPVQDLRRITQNIEKSSRKKQ